MNPNLDDFMEYLFVTGELNDDLSIKDEEEEKEEDEQKTKKFKNNRIEW